MKKKFEEIFTPQIKKEADVILARYETKRASILEILRLLMERYDFITLDMEEAVAEYLEIAVVDVREVMTFYSLFYSKPRAKTRLHVCRTLSCVLRGAHDLLRHLDEKWGIRPGETTDGNQVAVDTVECLGACEIAPMMQLNDKDYVGLLTKEKIDEILTKAGLQPRDKKKTVHV